MQEGPAVDDSDGDFGGYLGDFWKNFRGHVDEFWRQIVGNLDEIIFEVKKLVKKLIF